MTGTENNRLFYATRVNAFAPVNSVVAVNKSTTCPETTINRAIVGVVNILGLVTAFRSRTIYINSRCKTEQR